MKLNSIFLCKILILVILVSINLDLYSQVRVNGYYRKNGTYVQPHYRSSPDGNPYNNYSYPGNTNPYTGKTATGNADTYLNNYYKNRNSNYLGYSANNDSYYSNYYSIIYETNYSNLTPSNSYTKMNSDGKIISYINPTGDRNIYNIYNESNNYIGYVKLSRNRKVYTIYDNTGKKLTSNRKNIFGKIMGFTAIIGLSVLVGIASSMWQNIFKRKAKNHLVYRIKYQVTINAPHT